MNLKQILLLILIIILLFFIIYPFLHSNNNIREGVANSFSAVDISNIQQHLDTYNTTSEESSCSNAVKTIKALNLPNTNKVIQSSSDLPKCGVIDKISGMNIKNDNVIKAINACYGQKYSAVLNMITNIKTTDAYANNSNFTDFLNNASKYPSVTGNNTTAETIKTYLSAMGAANQMDKLQSSEVTEDDSATGTTAPSVKK